MRTMAIRAVFSAVHVNGDVISLLLVMAFLTFPGTFANQRACHRRWIVATHAMHLPHAGDRHPHVVMTTHALPVDWFAKPFHFAQMATIAGRACFQLRCDVMSDFFRDFFPMVIVATLLLVAATATHRARTRMRLVFLRRGFGGFGGARAARFTFARQTTSSRCDERADEQPFPRAGSFHNAPS